MFILVRIQWCQYLIRSDSPAGNVYFMAITINFPSHGILVIFDTFTKTSSTLIKASHNANLLVFLDLKLERLKTLAASGLKSKINLKQNPLHSSPQGIVIFLPPFSRHLVPVFRFCIIRDFCLFVNIFAVLKQNRRYFAATDMVLLVKVTIGTFPAIESEVRYIT